MHYILSPEADLDLQEIFVFINSDRPDAARQLILNFKARFNIISANPRMGIECQELQSGLRRHVLEKNLIFYRIMSDYVEIVRVLHGARDIESLF